MVCVDVYVHYVCVYVPVAPNPWFFFGGETQEKRDKGYVLEQLSAAKTVPFFPSSSSCLQFLYSILLFFFGVIYIQRNTQERKRFLFPITGEIV
jgi:hypothetical protein